MKKLSLLIALCMLLTVGGVYATWTYTQNTDVADEAVNMSLNLTDVAYSGSYGAYRIDKSTLSMTIDPKAGSTHTTSLVITGEIKIYFTPATYAPADVKDNGVASTVTLALTNQNWTYNDGTGAKNIVTLSGNSHAITWVDQGDGTFVYTIDAAELASHIELTEFELDTKAKYDSFNTALGNGQITISVSDGQTGSNP